MGQLSRSRLPALLMALGRLSRCRRSRLPAPRAALGRLSRYRRCLPGAYRKAHRMDTFQTSVHQYTGSCQTDGGVWAPATTAEDILAMHAGGTHDGATTEAGPLHQA